MGAGTNNSLEIKRVDDLKHLLDDLKDSSELYYLSLLIISSKIGKGSILPELVFLLDEKSLNNLLFYYGGETVKFPTLSELRDQLYGILMYYYYDVQGNSWRKSIDKLGVEYSGELSYKLRKLREEVLDNLKGIKIPEIIK